MSRWGEPKPLCAAGRSLSGPPSWLLSPPHINENAGWLEHLPELWESTIKANRAKSALGGWELSAFWHPWPPQLLQWLPKRYPSLLWRRHPHHVSSSPQGATCAPPHLRFAPELPGLRQNLFKKSIAQENAGEMCFLCIVIDCTTFCPSQHAMRDFSCFTPNIGFDNKIMY